MRVPERMRERKDMLICILLRGPFGAGAGQMPGYKLVTHSESCWHKRQSQFLSHEDTTIGDRKTRGQYLNILRGASFVSLLCLKHTQHSNIIWDIK
jgi:hypothetical protein